MNLLFLVLALVASGQAAAAPAIRWEPFSLPWTGVDLDAQLGRMSVPLRRAHPESGSVELAFVRLRSGDVASKISLLGHSYGTYLALAVIRAYGGTVERAALLATAGPNDMRKLPFMLDTQMRSFPCSRAKTRPSGRRSLT